MTNDTEAIIFDIETAPMIGINDYVFAGPPPANYTNPDAIARWTAAALEEQAQKGALDPDLCRIVAIGYQSDQETDPTVLLARNEDQEILALQHFWSRIRSRFVGRTHRLIGFNVLEFDLPVMMRRSLYLNIEVPRIQIDRFRHPEVDDIARILDFNGSFKRPGRSKEFYCRRFGIKTTDTISGKDIPRLAAAGEWDLIQEHCRLDIKAEVELAVRLGVFELRAECF